MPVDQKAALVAARYRVALELAHEIVRLHAVRYAAGNLDPLLDDANRVAAALIGCLEPVEVKAVNDEGDCSNCGYPCETIMAFCPGANCGRPITWK